MASVLDATRELPTREMVAKTERERVTRSSKRVAAAVAARDRVRDFVEITECFCRCQSFQLSVLRGAHAVAALHTVYKWLIFQVCRYSGPTGTRLVLPDWYPTEIAFFP